MNEIWALESVYIITSFYYTPYKTIFSLFSNKIFVFNIFAVYLQRSYAETILMMVGKSICNGRCERGDTIYGRSVYLSLCFLTIRNPEKISPC